MRRRHLLALSGLTVPVLFGGCLRPPGDEGGSSPDGVSVSVTSRADQPRVPVEYDVVMLTSIATRDRPARLRVTVANPTTETIVLGEEREIQFHHVASTAETVYLHPVGDGTALGPVDPGCWQLTDYVAVPEYYGTVTLEAGETVGAESFVYGHPALPAGTCLPDGTHQLRAGGMADEGPDAFDDESTLTDFEWGFTLRVGG